MLAEIAVGNTARVELCRIHGGGRSGELCAVKRLHPHVADDPQFVAMFQDEVWMTAALKSPHVVEMVGWSIDASGPWLAVELVRGVSLARLMKTVLDTGEMFSERLVVYIARSICAGLVAAHELRSPEGEPLGLVHRDLTPGNVLLGFQGEVKITDFGLAKAKQRVTRTLTGLLKGNPQYMSPEQVKSEGVDARSDIFAVGVLLFELFSGRRPWTATNDFDVMRAVTEDAPLELLELRPKVDRALGRLVARCLEKDPAARFQNARELHQQLDGWLDAHGYREGNEHALSRFVRRNAMRQMRWFERATLTDGGGAASDKGVAEELYGDFGEDGPTIINRAELRRDLGAPSRAPVVIVEATTVRQYAKGVSYDFDSLPTSKHRLGDAGELQTLPRSSPGGAAEVPEAASDSPPPGSPVGPTARRRAPPPTLEGMGPSARRRAPQPTLEGMGPMPVPGVLLAALASPPDAGMRAPSPPSAPLPPVPSAPPPPLLSLPPRQDTASEPTFESLGERSSQESRRAEARALDYSQEVKRIAGFAARVSQDARKATHLAAAAARAKRLATQAAGLAGRGLNAEAAERAEEARRLEAAVAAGNVPERRTLASDRYVGGLGAQLEERLDELRSRFGERPLGAFAAVCAVCAVLLLGLLVLAW